MSSIFDLLSTFTKVRTAQKQFADDRVDKLNRSTTVILFLVGAAFIMSRAFGSTIVCLKEGVTTTPIEMDYVNAMCYAQGTFKLNDFFASGIRDRTPATFFVSYPWMALILAVLAFLFYSPYLLWKIFVRTNTYQHVPIDINGLVQKLKETSSLGQKSNEFADKMKSLATYMDQSFALSNFNDGYLDETDEFGVKCDPHNGLQRPKCYRDRINKRRFRFFYIPLVFKYLFIKLIYLLISIAVFPLIDLLFGFRSLSFLEFGVQVMSRFCDLGPYHGNETHTNYVMSQYFPRHVLCKLSIRADPHEIHKYTFQCGLPANVFNEMVFLALWFWLAVLVVINLFSLLSWLFVLMRRRSMIREILTWPFRYNYLIDKFVDSFVYDYLSSEGFLIMMLIRSNTQDWHCRILMRLLWKNFMERIKGEDQTIECQYGADQETSSSKLLNDNQVNIKETPFRPTSSKNNYLSPEQEVKNISFNKSDLV